MTVIYGRFNTTAPRDPTPQFDPDKAYFLYKIRAQAGMPGEITVELFGVGALLECSAIIRDHNMRYAPNAGLPPGIACPEPDGFYIMEWSTYRFLAAVKEFADLGEAEEKGLAPEAVMDAYESLTGMWAWTLRPAHKSTSGGFLLAQ